MIDLSRVKTYPIKERKNKFSLRDMIPVKNEIRCNAPDFPALAQRVKKVVAEKKTLILMLGGAVVKVGCSDILIDLIKKGYVSHIAVNGAVSIHDFEIALIGETSEDVANGLQEGTFGMVEETGALINRALIEGTKDGLGYGWAVGRAIQDHALPYREHSIFYWAYKEKIPLTVHVAIGGDIIHQHPLCDGAVLGATSFHDFRILTNTVTQLKQGALLNFGSAVNLPEAFLKALTISRNLKYDVSEFLTANFDFLDMYRPRTRIVEWPKVLGCSGYNIRGNHGETIPALSNFLTNE